MAQNCFPFVGLDGILLKEEKPPGEIAHHALGVTSLLLHILQLRAYFYDEEGHLVRKIEQNCFPFFRLDGILFEEEEPSGEISHHALGVASLLLHVLQLRA